MASCEIGTKSVVERVDGSPTKDIDDLHFTADTATFARAPTHTRSIDEFRLTLP